MRWLGAVAVAAAFLTPGCLNDLEDTGRNALFVSKVDVAAPVATSGHVLLMVYTTLDNGGAQSGPVRVEASAYDASSGLLAARNETWVGRIAKDRTMTVQVGLDVPRAAGYRIEVTAYEDERGLRGATVTVSNVDGIPPNLHETGLRVSAMDFQVRNVSGNRVHIFASTYLTNEDAEPSRVLRMQVKAREVSTDLLADEAWTDVGSIGPEETRVHNVTLDVPGGYNYEVEATIWDGSYIVEVGSGHVQLLPTFTVAPGTSLVVQSPNYQDFQRSPGGGEPAVKKTPAFPWTLALVAIACVALIIARRRMHP